MVLPPGGIFINAEVSVNETVLLMQRILVELSPLWIVLSYFKIDLLRSGYKN